MEILHQLVEPDILNLHQFYKKHEKSAPQILNFLHNAIKWSQTNDTLIKVFSPHGDWSTDGTFIATLEYNSYEIYMYTLDKNCIRLIQALKETHLLKWKKDTLLYALHEDLLPYVLETIKDINVPVNFVLKNAYWIKSTTNICPQVENVKKTDMGTFYCRPLDVVHGKIINDHWPYRYEGSEKYVRTILEQNGGIGIFLEDELVCWVLQNGIGALSLLQTKSGFKKMGLASWVVSELSNKMIEEGLFPICTISPYNVGSQKTFANCGFKEYAKCAYIGVGPPTSIAFDCDYNTGLQK